MFSEAADSGVPVVNLHPESITAKAFTKIADTLRTQLPPKVVPEHRRKKAARAPVPVITTMSTAKAAIIRTITTGLDRW